MSSTEVRITGLGGQGSVLAGYIIGRAYSINAGLHASMLQSFGPEARGSACSATLMLSESEVLYPYVHEPDIFMVMSGEGYDKYRDEAAEDGTVIYESDLVKADPKKGQKAFGIPSTRIAESLGRTIVQNIVMLGFMTAVTQIVDPDDMRKAVTDSVPPGTEELNLKAFDAGFDYYEEEYGGGKKEKAEEPAGDEEIPEEKQEVEGEGVEEAPVAEEAVE
jgi:2-oxoglutarate ferredoxin oxidoreductase subunit gamma